jgi:hypothetical protein
VGAAEKKPTAWGRRSTVTPVRTDAGPIAQAWVDRYGRVVEGALRSGVRFVLVKTETEALGSFPARGRTECGKAPGGGWRCANR